MPVIEAIERCADLLFKAVKISVDKETFIVLAKIAAKVRKRTHPKRAGCPHGDNRPTRCPAHRRAVITEVRSLSPPSGAHRRWPGLEAVGMNLFTTLSIFDFREPAFE